MKTHIFWPLRHAALFTAVLAATAGCAENRDNVVPKLPDTWAAAPQQPVKTPAAAKTILMRMAQFLAKTPRFSVNLQDSYDVVQPSGQKIEFGETRKITVSRPNLLRVEARHSDGEKHLVLYDGKDITAFSPSHNVYAQIAKAGGIDAAVMYFLKDLHMRLPLAMLLVSSFPDELERRTLSLDYVERTEIDGKPVDHLAGRTETVDYQVWIAQGPQPLPLRAILTYKDVEGQPQFRAQFSDWNLAPEVSDALFAFTPPAESRKIAFLAQLPQLELSQVAAPEKTGGQK
ncbi:MAG: DUF2092 domain-containing protein [Gammaproteobacteria bacterium]